MKNVFTWILWLCFSVIFLLSTRNPFYILLILFNDFLLGWNLVKKPKGWLRVNLRFVGSMILISSIVNGLFTHIGQTVLFSIPKNWPLIGGSVTLESLIYGLINGLIIAALYLTFNILNTALSVRQLTQLIPRTFYPIAMTTTIALTFFPSIQQRAKEIKEAQMIRGNPMKNIPDWLPILLPLIVTSLEDAILLSESMTSRGYHAYKEPKNKNLSVIGFIIAAFLVASAWILGQYNFPDVISIALYLLGGFILTAILIFNERGVEVSHYRKELWNHNDVLGGVIFAIAILTLLVILLNHQIDLSYSPYPQHSIPKIDMIGLILSMINITPLLFSRND